MDMNGTWADTNATSPFATNKYDTWTGDQALEIWAARIKTDNLPTLGTSSNPLNAYLDKKHAFRTRTWNGSVKALVYNDDDWNYLAPSDRSKIQSIYGSTAMSMVNDDNNTTADDYKSNRLPLQYELIATRSHGAATCHGYYENSKALFSYVLPPDYTSIKPDSLFYSFFVCSGSDFSYTDNLAGSTVLNTNRNGPLAWGSTKTGGMWNEDVFYSQLANRACFGDAFIQWFNAVRGNSLAPKWWWGMVLIGDASLKPSVNMPGLTISLSAPRP